MRLRVNQPGEHITSFLFHSGDEQWYQVSGMWQQQATLCSYAMIVISAILLLQSGFRLHDQSEFQLHVGLRLVMFILLHAVIRMNGKGERHALR